MSLEIKTIVMYIGIEIVQCYFFFFFFFFWTHLLVMILKPVIYYTSVNLSVLQVLFPEKTPTNKKYTVCYDLVFLD